jgi:hypothetical protein
VAVDWLTTNGYDATDIGPDVLRPYFDEGMMLVAFRLTKQASTGDIRPVVLTFEDASPMIPIRPTAVAANDDMGVMTWVLGESRAVPTNYRTLVLNDAVIDWFTGGSNYNQVVNLAADEAGGQGFVTEMANPTDVLSNVVFADFEDAAWQEIRAADWSAARASLLQTMANQFSTRSQTTFANVPWDGLSDVFRAHLTLPEGVTAEEVMSCVSCYFVDEESLAALNIPAFLAAIEEQVVKPMRDTQALLDSRPYFTRLYTTLSAREMTIDPVFDFNPDLPSLSNQHTAERVVECSPDYFVSEAPWRATLPSGQVVRGQGFGWPVTGGTDMPFNARVLRMGLSGEGEIVTDNETSIQSELNKRNATVPRGAGGANGGSGTADDCGCKSVRAASANGELRGGGWWVLTLAGGAAVGSVGVALRRRSRT